MARMKWRRGTFEIKLTKRAIEDGKPNTAEGWISEPFAVHSDGYGIALTHLPTGAKIVTHERTIAGAKGFAERLLAAAGSHDWSGPRGASPKKATPIRSAWFLEAEKIFQAVHRGEAYPKKGAR